MYPGEAITIDLEPSIEELLETGLKRLEEKPTWKLWQWPPEQKEFLDADSFRCNSTACKAYTTLGQKVHGTGSVELPSELKAGGQDS